MGKTNSTKFIYFLAVFFPLSELIKQVVLYSTYGVSDSLWYFPFQLCSFPIFLLPLYLKNKSPVLETFIIDFSLLGGAFAFLDQSGMHYKLTILTVHSYLWHILMIAMGLYLITRQRQKPSWSVYLKAASLLLAMVAVATVLNLLLAPYGTINMFYISPLHPMNQIVFKDIAVYIGQSATRVLYVAMLICGGALTHAANRILSGFIKYSGGSK